MEVHRARECGKPRDLGPSVSGADGLGQLVETGTLQLTASAMPVTEQKSGYHDSNQVLRPETETQPPRGQEA